MAGQPFRLVFVCVSFSSHNGGGETACKSDCFPFLSFSFVCFVLFFYRAFHIMLNYTCSFFLSSQKYIVISDINKSSRKGICNDQCCSCVTMVTRLWNIYHVSVVCLSVCCRLSLSDIHVSQRDLFFGAQSDYILYVWVYFSGHICICFSLDLNNRNSNALICATEE